MFFQIRPEGEHVLVLFVTIKKPFPCWAQSQGWHSSIPGVCRQSGAQIFFGEPIMTFDTKLTMALAGCSGSCSANRWHTLSVALPCFRATNPKTLQKERRGQGWYSADEHWRLCFLCQGFTSTYNSSSPPHSLQGRDRNREKGGSSQAA